MYDIITIGSATKDIFISSGQLKKINDRNYLEKAGFVSGEAICFPLGSKINIEKPFATIGGRGVNTAVSFAKQGLKTASIISVGKDEEANKIIEIFKEDKISVFPAISSKLATAYSIVLISKGGERTILTYRGALDNDNQFPKLLGDKKARWAYFAPSDLNSPLTSKLISQLYKNGILIALNASRKLSSKDFKKIMPALKKVTVFILNREEASCLTGLPFEDKKEIFKKIDDAVGGIFIMTDGENGTLVSDNNSILEIGTFKTRPIDETGAGDAFGSGFIAGLIEKNEGCISGKCKKDNLLYAIRLGSANAASVVEHIGATEGILSKIEFKCNKRWKSLPIKIHSI